MTGIRLNADKVAGIENIFPRFSGKLRMSSPPLPKNPLNPSLINHFHQKNTWRRSYAPLGKIEVVEKAKAEGFGVRAGSSR